MKYSVKEIRLAGLSCKWAKTQDGAPIIVGNTPKCKSYYIDALMWKRAQEVGIMQAFEEGTALGEIFSITI